MERHVDAADGGRPAETHPWRIRFLRFADGKKVSHKRRSGIAPAHCHRLDPRAVNRPQATTLRLPAGCRVQGAWVVWFVLPAAARIMGEERLENSNSQRTGPPCLAGAYSAPNSAGHGRRAPRSTVFFQHTPEGKLSDKTPSQVLLSPLPNRDVRTELESLDFFQRNPASWTKPPTVRGQHPTALRGCDERHQDPNPRGIVAGFDFHTTRMR
jgi:hypothetical protein